MKIVASPIDVIATFSREGKPSPYKFRYIEKDAESMEIRIDKVISTEKQKLAGIESIVYTCQSEIDGIMRMYELKYIIGQHRWELYKI
jgi:hypothetical protein